MKLQLFLTILFMTFVFSYGQKQQETDVIKLIYHNREYISSLWDDCTPRMIRNDKFPCSGFQDIEKFKEFMDKPLEDWYSDYRRVINTFRGLCGATSSSIKVKGNTLNDSVMVKIAIALLTEKDTTLMSPANSAGAKILKLRTPYEFLNFYSKQIRSALETAQFDFRSRNYLAGFANLDTAEVSKIVNFRYDILPLKVRARLGDEGAKQSLFKILDSDTLYREKRKAVEAFGYIGSKESLVKLAEVFWEPWVEERVINITRVKDSTYYVNKCITESIKWPILREFQRHFPDEPLFYSETWKDGTETWKDGTETWKDGTETWKDGTETWKDGTETWKDGTET
ncbi:hypothetical protein QA601_14135 [Chitinispirillales bacterium ANBcel5]|uniref:hypothetical protein n=1 Tax=Cellulosispirillum alkaliphilum TaxID=3039283 RepID=UPI002A4EA417|nr:hypothetical protein [Chitinispirillales bacterium ANBcel5]